MRKIKRIYETTQEINFNSPQKEFSLYWNSFLESELGGIYRSIPWDELVKSFKIKEYRKGPTRQFSPQGNRTLLRIHNAFLQYKALIPIVTNKIDLRKFK